MKRIIHNPVAIALCYLLSGCFFSSCATRHNKLQTAIPYPAPFPDSNAITFLPGIVSSDSIDFNSAFSPDGRSFYFTRKKSGLSKIYITRYDGKGWEEPVLSPFSNTKYSVADPAFGPDGKLYFISDRPKNQSDSSGDYDIWFSKPLGDGGWSEPENLQIVNSDSSEYYISFSKNGNLYFASGRKGSIGEEDIYVSRLVNGQYTTPQNLGAAINSQHSEYDPCISPDEDLIIFSSSNREDSFGGADLYYSKLDGNKKWSPAVHFGKNFNTKSREYCSYFSPDGKYFFFSSGGDVKWVDIKAINKIIRP